MPSNIRITLIVVVIPHGQLDIAGNILLKQAIQLEILVVHWFSLNCKNNKPCLTRLLNWIYVHNNNDHYVFVHGIFTLNLIVLDTSHKLYAGYQRGIKKKKKSRTW